MLFAGATWGRAASPARRGPTSLFLGAVGLVTGFVLPAIAVVSGLVLLAVLDLREEPRRSGVSERGGQWFGSWWHSLCLALSLCLAVAAWSTARASLDPTPMGFVVALVSTTLAAAVACSMLPTGPGLAASALALACLATRIGLAALPHRTALWLSEYAGQADPRWVISGLMAVVCLPAGLAAGTALPGILKNRAREGMAWLATAAALLVGLGAGPDLGPLALWGAVVLGAIGFLTSPRLGPRLPALLALTGGLWIAWTALPWPEAQLVSPRATALRTTTALDEQVRLEQVNQLVAAGWGPDGAVRIETREGSLHRVVLEGKSLRPVGRMADAERLAGHLAPGLAPAPDRALVLGDDLGLVTEGLVTQLIEHILVAVPDTQGLRGIAEHREAMRSTFFDPSVQLVRGTSEQVLREGTGQDLIVEVTRAPWLDGRGGLPGRIQLRARRKALSDPGVYLLVLDLGWLEEEGFRGIVGEFVQEFRSVQAFLPPQGGDQVLLAGWKTTNRVQWDWLVQAATLGLEPLAELGVRSTMDLADRGIVGTVALRAFASGGQPPRRWMLPGTLHRRPRLLLALLEPHVEGPDVWLDNRIQPDAMEELRQRSNAARQFLKLLEAVPSGDMPGILEAAKDLDPRSLEPLIAPHLESARRLIEEGTEEGPNSMAWTECVRQLETARLVSPRSPEVLALRGRCRMVQDPGQVRKDFEAALELDPSHLDALLGLAQLQVKRGEQTAARHNLQRAAMMHPRRYEPFLHLGALLLAQGLLEEAEDNAARAKALAGDSSCGPLVLLAHIRILGGDPQSGLTYATVAEDRCGGAEPFYWKGVAYAEMNQVPQARTEYKKAILRDSRHYYAHFNLGLLDMATDPCRALESFNAAKALSPLAPPELSELRDEAGRRCTPDQ